MALKTHYKYKNSALLKGTPLLKEGFTLIELILVITVVLILLTGTVLLLNPSELLKRGRDNKRINDLSVIDRAITEYKVDYGSYPDTANTLRTSTTLPAGNTSLASPTSGWIKQNLSAYTSRLPIDPLNDGTYYFKYIQDGNNYELSAKLEISNEYSTADGGNDTTSHELGTDLTLISP